MTWQWLVVVCAIWLALSVAYVHQLRAIVYRRERTVLADLGGLAASAGGWTAALATASHRDWRRSVEGLQPVVETLSSSASLEARVAAASEIRSFLEQAARWVTQDPAAFPADVRGATEELQQALDRTQANLDEYEAAAVDATFAGRRFPLALIASVVGLRFRMPQKG
jgi:hypothetical protein